MYSGIGAFVIGMLYAGGAVILPDARALYYKHETIQTSPLLSVEMVHAEKLGTGGADSITDGDGFLNTRIGLADAQAEQLIEITPEETIDPNHSGEISIYKVKEGDTISEIADNFGISSNTIRWANELGTSGTIRVGQELLILPVTGVQYTVKSGDTISTIAKKFDGDTEEILVFNGIADAGTIKAGDKIIIPNGEEAEESHSKPSSSKPSTSSSSTSGTKVKPSEYYSRPVVATMTQDYHGSWRGRDYGAPTGTRVVASAEGTVISAKSDCWCGGYGSNVIISHPNGSQTLYGHLSSVSANVGDKVSAGDEIGRVGSTGRSTGPHLHFEIRNGGDIPNKFKGE